jgi:integrase
VRTLPLVCARLGLPRITATAARHTGITWAVSRVGITPALLRWTGHRNPNIVATVYAHAMPAQLDEIARAFDSFRIRRKVANKRRPPATKTKKPRRKAAPKR